MPEPLAGSAAAGKTAQAVAAGTRTQEAVCQATKR